MNFFSWRVISKRLGAIRHLMVDKTVPKRHKVLVVFGLIYLFSPLDLIPAVIFPVAWMDDMLLWIYIIFTLKEYLDKYWLGDPVIDLSKKFKSKTVVDDVAYSVEDEDEKKENDDVDDGKDDDGGE
jgi:uncharacterized membrane protein YkvA (DUF1232 family)